MNTVTYSEARNSLKTVCDQAQASHEVTRIVRKNGDMVLLSAEDWESIEETLHLANLPGAIERITFAADYQLLDDLEALLGETGELEEVRAMAAKKILAADIRHMMDQRDISKT